MFIRLLIPGHLTSLDTVAFSETTLLIFTIYVLQKMRYKAGMLDWMIFMPIGSKPGSSI